jgi:TonB family protein
MKQFSLSPQPSKKTPACSGTIIVCLTCSVFIHLAVFAYSYSWTMTADQPDPIFMVNLIDAPVSLEEKQDEMRETIDETPGRPRVVDEAGVTSDQPDTPSYLPTAGDFLKPELQKPGEVTPSRYAAEATVSLDSQDVKYVSYLTKIKKKIEPLWHYPEPARTIGLQGKLALCFSIVRNGQLTRLELLSSSGHPLLDEQALKAVKGAAPYFPLPERLKISRLNINATFEYRISPYNMSTFSQSSQGKSL